MILTKKLFILRCLVGASVQPALVVHADRMEDADVAVLLYYADHPDFAGQTVRILSATERALEDL